MYFLKAKASDCLAVSRLIARVLCGGCQLSMAACSPLEFLQQAKNIVHRHEQLKIAAASLQQTLDYLDSQPVCHQSLTCILRSTVST